MKIKNLLLLTVLTMCASLNAQSAGAVYGATKSTGTAAGGGNNVDLKMCWMETYGRGAGTIPTGCSGGKSNQNGLCYTACQAGYYGEGPVCWQNCPAGFRNDGAFCGKPAAYGRGGGYPWKFGDGFNDRGMYRRCQNSHGSGNCEKNGAIVYPKCKSGFYNVGCCVCSPNCQNGMVDIGVSCTKKSYGRGAGTIPNGCNDGKVNQGGLCYTACRTGYKGVGPVCWAENCPTRFPTKCGMGCAVNSTECGWAIFDQVSSVGEFVFNIATFGSGGAAAKGASTAAKTAGKAASKTVAKETMKQQMKQKAKDLGQELAETTAENAALTCYDAQLTGEFDWASLDPTGIANIVNAFNKPLCKDFH